MMSRTTSALSTLLLLIATCLPTVLLVIVLCVGAAEVQQIVLTTPIPRRHR